MLQMFRIFGLTSCLLIGGVLLASAQTPTTGGERIVWDQGATTLAEAQGFTYHFSLDAAAPIPVLGVVCGGSTPPYVRTADFPATVPGTHTLTATATRTVQGVAATSLPSNTLKTFILFTAPSAPQGLRIVP